MYPSDLLGNYYLSPIDRFLKEHGLLSARYVDDIYVFVKSVDDAERLLRELIPTLRSYDLVLNEAKSVIIPKEPDLEALFDKAVEEISQQLDDEAFDADYGFQSEWDDEESDEEIDEEDLELKTTMLLFDSISDYPGHEENIERFCLPLFTTAGSDHAVAHVMDSFKKRPSMSQIYTSYLSKFLKANGVNGFLLNLLKDDALVDWQKMWVLAALSQVDDANDDAVRIVLGVLRDTSRHDSLRAVAATYVGIFGDHARRKELVSIYSSVSTYVQAAIYYASSEWPSVERRNAKVSWGGNGSLNSLLTTAISTQ
jgi:hypothetical protein